MGSAPSRLSDAGQVIAGSRTRSTAYGHRLVQLLADAAGKEGCASLVDHGMRCKEIVLLNRTDNRIVAVARRYHHMADPKSLQAGDQYLDILKV